MNRLLRFNFFSKRSHLVNQVFSIICGYFIRFISTFHLTKINNIMTQQRLADELGITLSTVGRIECGIIMISLDLLVDIAVFFDVSLDFLILGKK